jgi:hypothetical protein
MPEQSEIMIRSITLSFFLGWVAVAALLRRRRQQHDSKTDVSGSSEPESRRTATEDAVEGSSFAESRPPLLRDAEQFTSSGPLEHPDTGPPPLYPQRSAENANGASSDRRVEFLIHNISHKVCVHASCWVHGNLCWLEGTAKRICLHVAIES